MTRVEDYQAQRHGGEERGEHLEKRQDHSEAHVGTRGAKGQELRVQVSKGRVQVSKGRGEGSKGRGEGSIERGPASHVYMAGRLLVEVSPVNVYSSSSIVQVPPSKKVHMSSSHTFTLSTDR